MTTLHHVAYSIAPNTLETVFEVFGHLGCTMSYREKGARWCLVEQEGVSIKIQLIETADVPVYDRGVRTNTHIAFISDEPRKVLEIVRTWTHTRGVSFREGGWSERELWFDLPDVFKNFVVEVMHTSVVEGG